MVAFLITVANEVGNLFFSQLETNNKTVNTAHNSHVLSQKTSGHNVEDAHSSALKTADEDLLTRVIADGGGALLWSAEIVQLLQRLSIPDTDGLVAGHGGYVFPAGV